MPTKYNHAGQQQPYVPAGNGDESGEYRDNAYGNDSFVSQNEPSKSKEKPLGVEIKSDGDKEKDISKIKKSYDGKGNQELQTELKRRMGKSSNYKKVSALVEGADDELSGVIADYYKSNEDTTLKFGSNLRSHYMTTIRTNYISGTTNIDRSVLVGQGLLNQQDFYSKGGVFFHESAHALDDTYMLNGRRSDWSHGFISKKHGVSLADMISQEIKENLGGDKLSVLENEIAKEKEDIEKTVWTPEMNKELEDIKLQLDNQFKALEKDEKNQSLIKRNNDVLNDIVELRKVWMEDYYNDQKRNDYVSKRELYIEYSKELSEYQNSFYNSNFPNRESLNARKNDLSQAKWGTYEKVKGPLCVKYGDISDMIQGSLGQTLKQVGMGHSGNYWNSRSRGREAFAEIMSAKATNPESLEVLKKYVPKSIEIFDEIIDTIKSKGSN